MFDRPNLDWLAILIVDAVSFCVRFIDQAFAAIFRPEGEWPSDGVSDYKNARKPRDLLGILSLNEYVWERRNE